MCDNTSTIKLSKNPVLHGRSKHIRVRFHFLRDLTKEGIVNLLFCGTRNQLADLLTKPLKLEALGSCTWCAEFFCLECQELVKEGIVRRI